MLVSAHQRSYLALFRAVLCSTVAQSTKTIHRKEFPLPSAPHAGYQVTENSLRFRDPLSRRGDGGRQLMIEDASQRSLRYILDAAEQLHIGKTRSSFDARSLPQQQPREITSDRSSRYNKESYVQQFIKWQSGVEDDAELYCCCSRVKNANCAEQPAVTKKMPNWFQRDFRVRITSVNVWET